MRSIISTLMLFASAVHALTVTAQDTAKGSCSNLTEFYLEGAPNTINAKSYAVYYSTEIRFSARHNISSTALKFFLNETGNLGASIYSTNYYLGVYFSEGVQSSIPRQVFLYDAPTFDGGRIAFLTCAVSPGACVLSCHANITTTAIDDPPPSQTRIWRQLIFEGNQLWFSNKKNAFAGEVNAKVLAVPLSDME